MQHYIDYITKKCHEANPKLKEPSIGCAINYKGERGIIAGFDIPRCTWLMNNIHGNIMPVGFGLEEVEILGHPIQLSDILMAVDASDEWKKHSEASYFYMKLLSLYDYSLPFLQQSDEFFRWTAERLGYSTSLS